MVAKGQNYFNCYNFFRCYFYYQENIPFQNFTTLHMHNVNDSIHINIKPLSITPNTKSKYIPQNITEYYTTGYCHKIWMKGSISLWWNQSY